MIATYMVAGRWYYLEDATLVANTHGHLKEPRLWSGWIWVNEKKYHTDYTVTIIGYTTTGPATPLGFTNEQKERVVLEMRRKLTVKTLKDGPPVYVINEQTLT